MSAMSLDVTPKGSVEIETLVNGPIQTNSYAVISDNECVIIDPAWEGERLVEHIRAKHPGVRMLGVVCTHGHADHVGGVAGVRTTVGEGCQYELCSKDVAVPHANIEEQRAMWGIETSDPGEPDASARRGRYSQGGRYLPAGDRDARAYAGRDRLVCCHRAGEHCLCGRHPVSGWARPHRSCRWRRGGDSALALQARPASSARYRLPNRPWRFDHHGTRAHAEPFHAGVAL